MGTAEIVGVAGAIIAALLGAIAKLWLANAELRKEAAAERATAASERERAQQLETQLNHEHKRDLRYVLGIPTSLDPPPAPPLVRDERPRPPRPRKKPGT